MGEISTTKLAEQVDVSPATMVTILDNLERDHLVTRTRSSEDRRIVHTRLTEAGAAVLARAPGPFSEVFARNFARLPEEQRQRILSSIATLAEMMTNRAG